MKLLQVVGVIVIELLIDEIIFVRFSILIVLILVVVYFGQKFFQIGVFIINIFVAFHDGQLVGKRNCLFLAR